MKVHCILLFLLICITPLYAQTYTWDDFIAEFSEADSELAEEDIDELYELHVSPINVNELYSKSNAVLTTINSLRKLPFITDTQINALEYYVNHNYPVQTLGELMLIRELDYYTRMRLMLFLCVGEPKNYHSQVSLANLIRNAKNEAIIRTDIPFYKKKGYVNDAYNGSPLYHSLRYQIKSMNHASAGFQLEKDAGERGVDYFSAYLVLQDVGSIGKLVVGDYKLSLGMGLTIHNNMSFGKQMFLSSFNSLNRGITKHSSMSEANHLRGIATTVNINKNLHFTGFFSYQNLDGTLRNDSTNGISSLKTDGLHRTALEKSKKGNLTETTWGGNLEWQTGNMAFGFTAINTHLSKPLLPKFNTPSSEYRKYNLQGTDFAAFSLSYKLRFHQLLIQGETAYSQNDHSKYSTHYGGLATVNAFRYKVNSYTSLVSILRYYDHRYSTLYGKSFSSSSKPQNEMGAFVGVKSDVSRKWQMESYLDFSKNPKATMQSTAGANAIEASLQMTYIPSKKSTLQLRYRLKSKEKDYEISNTQTDLYYQTNHNLKAQYNRDLGGGFSSRTNALVTYVFNPENSDEIGYLLSENLRWETGQSNIFKGIKIGATITYFNTDSYNSRVYANEPSLLYVYGMSSYYGRGIRMSLMSTFQLTANLNISAKIGSSKYFDRDAISSGSEQINASHREDLQIQARWKF